MEKKTIILLSLIFAVIFSLICWLSYEIYRGYQDKKLRQTHGWKDAHPTKEQVDKWILKNFDSSDYKIWNKNPKLEGPEFCTGIVKNKITSLTPFGENNWGMAIYSWGYTDYEKTAVTYPAEEGKLQKDKRGNIYLFVKHRKKGQYAVSNILPRLGTQRTTTFYSPHSTAT